VAFIAVPYWVIRLHDRYVSRAALECWYRTLDSAASERFAKSAANELFAEFNGACRGSDCSERIWAAMYARKLVTPGAQRGYACRMLAVAAFRHGAKEHVADAVASCPAIPDKREALACQIGQVASMQDLGPADLWSDSEGVKRLWSFGVLSGHPLLMMVFELHGMEAMAMAILDVTIIMG
jgi:hypothetical protein